ncbi:MAG TPA: porin [Usitatibacter sp.]|nr:porin [Usitatibacter sp.]
MPFPTRALRGACLAAATVAVPAAAQQPGVQIYGTLNVDVESVAASGASPPAPDVPRRVRVSSNSSNLGLRGAEKLGRELEAHFQVESAVNVDAGQTSIASRNTGVGLRGPWGSFLLGQWDTPYKTLSGAVDPMYFTGIAYTGALIGTPGFGVGPTTIGAPSVADGKFSGPQNASFERRQGNSVQYWLPELAGFAGRIAYSVNESRTAANDPRILSASLEYSRGAFYAAWAHEIHDDYFGLGALGPLARAIPAAERASSRDRGDKVVLRVQWGGTRIGLMGEELRYRTDRMDALAGELRGYRRRAAALTLTHKVGIAGTVRGLVGKAWKGSCERVDGAACDASALGARQASIGYSYTFSARTDGYLFYTRVANDARATYQFANGAGLGAAPGSTSTGIALGLRHTF